MTRDPGAGASSAAVQRADQRVRQVPAPRIGAAADQGVPGEPGHRQQPGVVAGQHRHCPRAGAAHGHDHAAGPARDIGAAHLAQVAADQPGAGPEADQPGRPHPPLAGGLRVRQCQEPGDLRRAAGLPGPLPGQRQVRRIELGHHPAPGEPQVRAQRAARRTRQPRRAPGEPLGGRRVQQHLRHRLQPQPDCPVREPARRPQQVLRPFPAFRPGPGDHVPRERGRRRRHRRRPPPPDIGGNLSIRRTHTALILYGMRRMQDPAATMAACRPPWPSRPAPKPSPPR